MTQSRTAAQLIAAAKELADQDQPGTGPTFVDTTEALERVNEAIGALWDLLVAEGAEELLYKVQQQVGVVTPTWPNDLMRLVQIEVKDGERWRPLERLDLRDDWTADATDDLPTHYIMSDVFDTLAGVHLSVPVYPPRAGGATYTYRIKYVQEPAEVTATDDDIVLPNRWHTWVKYELALLFLAKEETESPLIERKQAKVEMVILKAAARTDLGKAHKLRRSRRSTRNRRNPRDGGWWGMPT